MKNIKLTQRQRYEHMYRMLRQGAELEIDDDMPKCRKDAIKAADYSYQAFAYIAHGWSTDERLMRFHAIRYRVLTQRGELPF